MHFGGKLGSNESGRAVPSDQERKEQDSACGPQSTASDDTQRETGTQKAQKKTDRKREMLQRSHQCTDPRGQGAECWGKLCELCMNCREKEEIHKGRNMTFSKSLSSLRKRKK